MARDDRYMGDERRKYEGQWHLDKKFSIGIILAICLQCACFIWYGAKLDAQVQVTKTDVSELRIWREKQDDEKAKIESRLATVDQELKDQGELLRRIAELLENNPRRR